MPTGSGAASNCSIRCMAARASLASPAGRESAGSWWGDAGRTIVRSVSEADDLIGKLRDRFRFGDVVNAHDVRTGQDRSSDGGGRYALQRRLTGLRQERFSRRADENRQLERGQFGEASQDLRVLFFPFSETEPWIDNQPCAIAAGTDRTVHGGIEIVQDRAERILERRELGPSFRSPA